MDSYYITVVFKMSISSFSFSPEVCNLYYLSAHSLVLILKLSSPSSHKTCCVAMLPLLLNGTAIYPSYSGRKSRCYPGHLFTVIFHIYSATTCKFYLLPISIICLLLCPPTTNFFRLGTWKSFTTYLSAPLESNLDSVRPS